VATIYRALRRNHPVAPQPPWRPKASRRFEREAADDLWQIDGTEVTLASGEPAWVVDCLDDHARFLLAAIACASPTGDAAWACFAAASSADGLPRQLLSDNHLSFTGRLYGFEVAVERKLAEVGVKLINTAPPTRRRSASSSASTARSRSGSLTKDERPTSSSRSSSSTASAPPTTRNARTRRSPT
jgi:Integrase core domain